MLFLTFERSNLKNYRKREEPKNRSSQKFAKPVRTEKVTIKKSQLIGKERRGKNFLLYQLVPVIPPLKMKQAVLCDQTGGDQIRTSDLTEGVPDSVDCQSSSSD